jgi:hypothetical protein
VADGNLEADEATTEMQRFEANLDAFMDAQRAEVRIDGPGLGGGRHYFRGSRGGFEFDWTLPGESNDEDDAGFFQ